MKFIDLEKQYQIIAPEIMARIQGVLSHGQYIMGPEIEELERALAAFIGVRHAIVNASGTDALLMALMALDIGPGDEIITVPFSFFATVEAIVLCREAKPVFVDIDPYTYTMDPKKIEAAITAKTRAIMPVSLYGQCADMTAINAIAAQYKLPVIEDGAQSFGASHFGEYSCTLSTLGTTSFFPAKPLGGYGDSGACFTQDDVLAETLREIRIHGQSARYKHKRMGINGRMDTLQAAILLEKLQLFPKEIQQRQAVAERYNALLGGIVSTPKLALGNTSVYAQYTIEVDDRDRLQQRLQERGIPTAIHYPIALHQQEALAFLGHREGDFPQSERASQRVLSLPMHPYLSEKDQDAIVEAIRESV